MIDNIEITKHRNYVNLHYIKLADFRRENSIDIVSISTSEIIINFIKQKINFEEYDKYFIYFINIPFGYYNSITDKKGIWGLLNTKRGLYENSFTNDMGKVYFGISNKVLDLSYNGVFYSINVYIPKNYTIDFNEVFNVFNLNDCRFKEGNYNNKLSELHHILPNSIILDIGFYNISIYSENIENIF